MSQADKPHIVQCLCPQRHCILAYAYQGIPDEEAVQELKHGIAVYIETAVFDPFCAICGAKQETWFYEAGVLRSPDWETALKDLIQSEREQQITREWVMLSRKRVHRN